MKKDSSKQKNDDFPMAESSSLVIRCTTTSVMNNVIEVDGRSNDCGSSGKEGSKVAPQGHTTFSKPFPASDSSQVSRI
jgi:hypothetical protein